MTGQGADIDFPIGYPAYLAPESIFNMDVRKSTKQDIWSLGIVLVEQYTRCSFWTTSDLGLIFTSLSMLAKWGSHAWQHDHLETLDINENVIHFLQQTDFHSKNDMDLHHFILDCLQVDPTKRPSGHSLLSSRFLSSWINSYHDDFQWIKGPALVSDDRLDNDDNDNDTTTTTKKSPKDILQGLPISQVYNLWKLAGGDVELDAEKRAVFSITPVIERLPQLCGLQEGMEIGTTTKDSAQLYSDTICKLGYKELYQRLDQEQRTNGSMDWDTDYFMVVDDDDVNFLLDGEQTRSGTDDSETPLEDEFIFTDDTTTTATASKIPDEPSIASPRTPQRASTTVPTTPPASSRSGRRTLSFTGLSRSNSISSLPPTSPTNITSPTTTPTTFSTTSGSHSSISHLASSTLAGASIDNITTAADTTSSSSKLPLFLREQDVNYQFRRQALFSALLQQYPASKKELIHHAKVDIPPLLRGKVWAAILGVHGNVQQQYSDIGKCIDIGSDRQIDMGN
jgi:serine/threonine protein kinase